MAAEERDYNADPLTGEPGAHPVGTGLGATGGAVAGAAAGSFAGPAGTVVGGVAGAVAGGLAGKAAAEGINPTVEEAYWRGQYLREPYYRADRTYDDYGPAYRLGWSSRRDWDGEFDTLDTRLQSEWDTQRSTSRLTWPEALPAVRAAWERADAYRATGTEDAADTDDVVTILNDLIEICRDGDLGFSAAAGHVKTEQLKSTLQRRASECRAAAAELETHVVRLGGKPEHGGTTRGALHRGWVALRGAVTSDSDEAMLSECERGEDAAVAAYRKALKKNLPAVVRTVVEHQYEGALRNHDQIKSLRDQAKALNG